jgi:hypothetical protein
MDIKDTAARVKPVDPPPGRELDALVAEVALKHTVYRNAKGPWSLGPPYWMDLSGEMLLSNPLPLYSEDMAAAWELVEAIGHRLCLIKERTPTTYTRPYKAWFSSATGVSTPVSYGVTAAHALCLAALRAQQRLPK